MYDLLKEVAGLNSKDCLSQKNPWTSVEVEATQEKWPWGLAQVKEEEESEAPDYSWVWDLNLPKCHIELDSDSVDDWDVLTPNDMGEEFQDYLTAIQDSLNIDFPDNFWDTDFSDLFLFIDDHEDGIVTISVDEDCLIDYLTEEC